MDKCDPLKCTDRNLPCNLQVVLWDSAFPSRSSFAALGSGFVERRPYGPSRRGRALGLGSGVSGVVRVLPGIYSSGSRRAIPIRSTELCRRSATSPQPASAAVREQMQRATSGRGSRSSWPAMSGRDTRHKMRDLTIALSTMKSSRCMRTLCFPWKTSTWCSMSYGIFRCRNSAAIALS